jgi:hypothetical protein
MITDVLFGIKTEDMEEIKEILEDILSRKLQAREGLHMGEYYSLPFPDDYLYLRHNANIEDGEIEEEEFPEYPIVLYIEDVNKYPEYFAAIQARSDVFVKLRTNQWQPRGE